MVAVSLRIGAVAVFSAADARTAQNRRANRLNATTLSATVRSAETCVIIGLSRFIARRIAFDNNGISATQRDKI
jgi:hypothetical protein